MAPYRMKLFSLLMGNSGPPEEASPESPPTDMASVSGTQDDPPSDVNNIVAAPGVADPVVTPPSPHYSINLDRLRRIFQALSSLNQNKATEAEVDEEPLQMRRKYLSIFERFEMKFGKNKSSADSVSKRRTTHNAKERFMAFINRRNANVESNDKRKRTWARNLDRLTSSMRHVKSDSFLAKKISKKRNKRKTDDQEQIRLPSMKTKKRSTVSGSKALINSASQTAHMDLVKHLQKNSSQHCLDDIDFWNFNYPFENLVFEGGGAKVHTYIGAIKCLEEAGIKPKRLAGTSAGAITAGLLAVGYTSEEIHILYEYDVEYNVKDGTCGLLSLLPNMFRHYGWNPGDRATKWFGECLAVKTRNPDITFQEVLDQYGVELCIVAVNLSNRCEEYFHPKTSPHMPIKLAARMSSSLPGYFQPVRQGTNVYIDGGLLCNYPVHVFDGWFLSMDPEDVFYKKMGSLENLPRLMERKNRFGGYNDKTLGFCMFSMFDDKALRFELEKRHKLKITSRPKTKLAMKRMKLMNERSRREVNRDTRLDALSRFLKVLRTVHIRSGDRGLNRDDLISEFEKHLSTPESPIEVADDRHAFTNSHCEIIFGKEVDLMHELRSLQVDGSGTVSSADLIAFLNKHKVDIQSICGDQYIGRPEVSNFGSFFMTIQESLMNSARRVYIQTEDLDRTVGINTDYIKMDDFSLEREDQEFLIQQGYKATAAFLRYFIHHKKPRVKSQPTSVENSDLSADESDSPVYSGDSAGELSEGEAVMAASLTSQTSPAKNSPPTAAEVSQSGEDNHSSEEVIVAEVEIIPQLSGPADVCSASMQSLVLEDNSSHLVDSQLSANDNLASNTSSN